MDCLPLSLLHVVFLSDLMKVMNAFCFLDFLAFPVNLLRSLCLLLCFCKCFCNSFCDVMATYICRFFTSTSLTEGRSARDLPKQQKNICCMDELFHDHDRLLFAWGQSEFLCLQKQLPCCAKVAMLPFWLQLVK